MMREHFGDGGDAVPLLAPRAHFNSGDGIRMAQALGADLSGEPDGMHIEPVDPRSKNQAAVVLLYPYGIVVDRDGRRFFDEGAGLVHETWEAFSRRLHFEVPGRIAYAILDARVRAIPDWQRATRSEVPPFEAATLAELAKLIGVDADNLARDGRGLQRRLHRRSAKIRRHASATASPRRRRSRRRNRTGRAPSSSRRSSPGRSSAPSPTPSAGLRPTPAPAFCAAARRSPASTPPARSPGISTAPRRTRCRCCARSCSAGSPGGRRFLLCRHGPRDVNCEACAITIVYRFDEENRVAD